MARFAFSNISSSSRIYEHLIITQAVPDSIGNYYDLATYTSISVKGPISHNLYLTSKQDEHNT
jgi:hypothetical protein